VGVVPIMIQGAIGEKECSLERVSNSREPLVPSSGIIPSRLPETFIGVERLRIIGE
jgi:hypothetical protein